MVIHQDDKARNVMNMDNRAMNFVDQQGRRGEKRKLELHEQMLYYDIGRLLSFLGAVLCPSEEQDKFKSDVRFVTRHAHAKK